MSRYAILAHTDATSPDLAVTLEDDHVGVKLHEYKVLPSQIWVPIFHIGTTTAGVAFLNTAGPTVALRGDPDKARTLYATNYWGQNSDDHIIWSFTSTGDKSYMNIVWVVDPQHALNAAYRIAEGVDVIIFPSKPRPINEQWRLLSVTV